MFSSIRTIFINDGKRTIVMMDAASALAMRERDYVTIEAVSPDELVVDDIRRRYGGGGPNAVYLAEMTVKLITL